MTAQPPDPLDRATTWVRTQHLARSTGDSWFAGVCAGLAHRFAVDPLLIRAAFIVLTFFGGIGIVLYLALWLALPTQDGRILAEEAVRRRDGAGILLLIGFAFALFLGLGVGADSSPSVIFVLPLLALGWLLYSRSTPRSGGASLPSTPPPPPPADTTLARDNGATYMPTTAPPAPVSAAAPTGGVTFAPNPPPPIGAGYPTAYTPPTPPVPPTPPQIRRRRPSGYVGLISLGLVLTAFGAAYAIATQTASGLAPGAVGMIAALGAASLITLALGVSGRTSGFTGFLTACLLGMAPLSVAAAQVDVPGGGMGDRVWVPTSTSQTSYSMTAGKLTVDLSDVATTAGRSYDVTVGAGQVIVLVPAGTDVEVRAEVELGTIGTLDGDVVRSSQLGTGTNESATVRYGTGSPDLTVTATVRLGEILIETIERP